MFQPTVSVIINTYNRCPHLKRLLDCLCRQTYDNFEVVVVNGPSTDNTEGVLEAYGSAIRIDRCERVNLCESRNISVRAAAGEILAFIDDDAVPQDIYWIEKAVALFRDESVAVVGGTVLRINGAVEFRYGTSDIWGGNDCVREVPEYRQENETAEYNRAQGCNFFVRSSAVRRVGGFDEYYAYYLDESDLCYRICRSGEFRCIYGEDIAVIHEAAKGANRKSEDQKNWYVISRSSGYYVMKATEDTGFSVDYRRQKALESVDLWIRNMHWLEENKRLTEAESRRYIEDIERGVREGIEDSLTTERRLDFNIPFEEQKFKRFNKTVAKNNMNLCFICEGDTVSPVGGTQVHTKALAEGLARAGHNVFVISRGDTEELNLVNGYNICTITPSGMELPELAEYPNGQIRIAFSAEVYRKVRQLKKVFGIQLLESPIWDSTGVVSAYAEEEIPVVTRLQTPMKMVIDTFKKEETPDLDFLMQLEYGLMRRSDAIITISDCVRATIEDLYGFRFTQPVYKNYLGFPKAAVATSTRKHDDGKLVVFFIGRLERRKGIDSILASIPGIMRKFPNTEFRLAGDCDLRDDVIHTTYKEKFLRDNAGASWLDQVKFLGKISETEKEQEFADCDVFVSPSLYESFGIIFVEAMRVGKPVIGCKVGGMQEVIKDGVTGRLAEPGDAESFEKCLSELLQDYALRKKMGAAGLKRYQEMFTAEEMCRVCEEIYRDIIAKHGRKKPLPEVFRLIGRRFQQSIRRMAMPLRKWCRLFLKRRIRNENV